MTIVWSRVSGQATGGASIDSQEVRARPKGATQDSSSVVIASMPAEAVEGTISGLMAKTTYFVSVRTHNVLGWSDFSEAILGTTPEASGSKQPSQPLAPRLASAESDAPNGAGEAACDVLKLELPPLRGGCDHDDHLTLEWRVGDSSDWQAVPRARFVVPSVSGEMTGGTLAPLRLSDRHVVLNGLDALVAYRFRVTAHNSAGSSMPSVPSSAVLTQGQGVGTAAGFGAPPKVLVTS